MFRIHENSAKTHLLMVLDLKKLKYKYVVAVKKSIAFLGFNCLPLLLCFISFTLFLKFPQD